MGKVNGLPELYLKSKLPTAGAGRKTSEKHQREENLCFDTAKEQEHVSYKYLRRLLQETFK